MLSTHPREDEELEFSNQDRNHSVPPESEVGPAGRRSSPTPREAEECDLFHLDRSLVLLHKGWTQHTDLAVLFLEETKCGLNCE